MDTTTALILVAFGAGVIVYRIGKATAPALLQAARERRTRRINVRHAAASRLSGQHGGWFTGRHRDVALLTTSAVVLLGVARVGWWLR